MGNSQLKKMFGMNVHPKSISIAIADHSPDGEMRFYGTAKNTVEAIDKVLIPLVSISANCILHLKLNLVVLGFIVISLAMV